MIRLNQSPEAIKAVMLILLGKAIEEITMGEVENEINLDIVLKDSAIMGRMNRIASLLDERSARCIRTTGAMKGDYNPNDIYYINRGEPYTKTIVFFQSKYFWASYGEIVENNYPAYI